MKAEYKIIADHLRSTCFLIADGALPSNEGRGYVLRRIMRRAMRQLHKLGAREVSMYKMTDALIEEMGEAYPELSRAREVIVETLKNEEEKFRETLEKGLKILEEEIIKIAAAKSALSGAIAFKLYDTYGFPLDLTQDILREKGLSVDEEEFNREMEIQRERAKASWKGSGEEIEDKNILELQNQFGSTKFLGYDKLENTAKIIYLAVDGKKVAEINSEDNAKNITIILDQTAFYATSGGQKGDDGKLTKSQNKIEIFEARKVGKLFTHHAKNLEGIFKIGDEIIASVNPKTRAARASNHSATHLMHKALKLILGNSISQKGSNVDADYFTFDFNFNRGMSVEEVSHTEDLVNFYIAQNSQSKTEIMALEKAREQGAEALFGEKYDSEVRVVSMGNDEEKKSPYSIELCGGTHVKSTGEIEFFKIISEKSIASGIRRIEAKSGVEAKNYVLGELKKLQNEDFEKAKKIAELSNEKLTNSQPVLAQSENFDYKKIAAIIKNLQQEISQKDSEIKALQKKSEQLKKQNLLKNLDDLKVEKLGELQLISHHFQDVDAKDLREIIISLKSKSEFKQNSVFALFASNQDKVAACVAISDNLLEKYDANILIKDVVAKIGGNGGGGKKDLAMGGGVDANGIENAIATLKDKIK